MILLQEVALDKQIFLSVRKNVSISSIRLAENVVCFQLYDGIMDLTEIAQTRLCPTKHCKIYFHVIAFDSQKIILHHHIEISLRLFDHIIVMLIIC